jgi:hypothetical protein
LGSGLYPARRFDPRKFSTENLLVIALSFTLLGRIAVYRKITGLDSKRNDNETNF